MESQSRNQQSKAEKRWIERDRDRECGDGDGDGELGRKMETKKDEEETKRVLTGPKRKERKMKRKK